ncbi:hypothetical protein JCM8097_001685 [Rhodosporidiobolus ruineniae]
MSAQANEYSTLLVLWPLQPTILDSLRSSFERVIYRPIQGPSPADAPRPTQEEWEQTDAVFSFAIPEELTSVEQVPRLKFWQGASAGYSHIEASPFFKSLKPEDDITFANASGIQVSTIGEHCLATVLMLYHKLHTIAVRHYAEQMWLSQAELGGNYIRELNTLTVGIVEYGHIGRETARLFHSCGSTIYALTRSGKPTSINGFLIPNTGDPDGSIPSRYFASISRESRDEFFGACDVVINTLPESDRTRDTMADEEFRAMKGDAVYVNIGRGTTTDTEVLVQALKAQKAEGEEAAATGTLRIGGASLDVTNPQPLPPNHALFTLSNAIITPHMSGASLQYFQRAIEVLKVNVERLRQGKGALNGWWGRKEE